MFIQFSSRICCIRLIKIQVWGVTVGGTILQNELTKKLPSEFLQQFPSGTSVAYSIIPVIPSLQEPLRSQVQLAFAESLVPLWKVLAFAGAAGMIGSFLMRGLPLHTAMDRDWGMEERAEVQEKGTESSTSSGE